MTWVLGLDGGGSKTALAYASAAGEVVGPYHTTGVNPFDQPAWAADLTAFLRAHPAPGPLAHATLGLPGYGESPEVSARQEQLSRDLIRAPLSILNDVQAAFEGAFPDGPGVLLLAGTGSMAWARDGARQVRVGGWGDGFGDEGSAHHIGRCALGVASQALDGRHPDRDFARALLEPLLGAPPDQTGVLAWYFAQRHARSAVASLARRVDALAASGQPTAVLLLQDAAAHLARHVHAARARLGAPQLPWRGAGSVLNSRTVLAALTDQLGAAPLPAPLPPLGGALLHAARQADLQPDAAWTRRVNAVLTPPVGAP